MTDDLNKGGRFLLLTEAPPRLSPELLAEFDALSRLPRIHLNQPVNVALHLDTSVKPGRWYGNGEEFERFHTVPNPYEDRFWRIFTRDCRTDENARAMPLPENE